MNAAGNGAPATTTAVYTLANVPSSLSASQSGSTIVVTWSANSNPGGTEYYVADTTDGTNSGWITTTTHTFSSPSTSGSHTITVKSRNAINTETTTTSTTVSYTPAGGGGGGGGGGGSSSSSSSGGSVTLFATYTPTTTTSPQTPNQTPQTQPTVSTTAVPNTFLITKIVEPYSTSNNVTVLQGLLATDPSIYPEGKITGYYGALTIKAVQNFQKKYGIISGGSLADGFGRVGPKTLAKIKEIYGQTAQEPSKIETPIQTSPQEPIAISKNLVGPFLMGGTSEQNKILQQYLAKDVSIYPEGMTTGYYGALTKKAVGRFQEKYNITKPGDEFYGYAGPNTRAKIVEVLGQ
jgi:peptidoglycan hydrolase-like protein with peptidoglycan-binding domain